MFFTFFLNSCSGFFVVFLGKNVGTTVASEGSKVAFKNYFMHIDEPLQEPGFKIVERKTFSLDSMFDLL